MRRVGWLLFGNAFGKALGLGVLGLLGNVFAGSYVFEITRIDKRGVPVLDWAETPSTWSFWALVLIAFALGLYAIGIARYERQIRKALTEAEVHQRALEVLLEPTLEAIKKDVEGGKKFWSMREIVGLFSTESKQR